MSKLLVDAGEACATHHWGTVRGVASQRDNLLMRSLSVLLWSAFVPGVVVGLWLLLLLSRSGG